MAKLYGNMKPVSVGGGNVIQSVLAECFPIEEKENLDMLFVQEFPPSKLKVSTISSIGTLLERKIMSGRGPYGTESIIEAELAGEMRTLLSQGYDDLTPLQSFVRDLDKDMHNLTDRLMRVKGCEIEVGSPLPFFNSSTYSSKVQAVWSGPILPGERVGLEKIKSARERISRGRVKTSMKKDIETFFELYERMFFSLSCHTVGAIKFLIEVTNRLEMFSNKFKTPLFESKDAQNWAIISQINNLEQDCKGFLKNFDIEVINRIMKVFGW